MTDFDKFVDSVEDGNLEVVKQYFDEDFLDKIDHRSDNNMRPLHIACRKGNLQVAEYLLEKGSDVDAETTNGKRAVHFAAMEGHADVVRLLIVHYCDLEPETINGERPAHYAAMKGHADVLRTLISNKCQLEPCDKDGNTPLALAIMCEDEECTKLLEEAIGYESFKQMTETSKHADLAALKELVNHNFLTTIVDTERGETLLDAVLKTNDKALLEVVKMKPVNEEEVVELLALRERCISAQSYTMLEECLLYRCIRHSTLSSIPIVCTPEVVNRDSLFMGLTALETAVMFKSQDTLKSILKKLMKIDESWGRAKKIAEGIEYSNMVDQIVSRENYVERREKNGYSRLPISVYDNAPDVTEYLLLNKLVSVDEGDKKVGPAISFALVLDNIQCMKVLERYSASADATDKFRQTPLHIAIASGMLKNSSYLVDTMKDLEAKDFFGFTVLDRARRSNLQELCDQLIKRGAKYNEDIRSMDKEEYALPII